MRYRSVSEIVSGSFLDIDYIKDLNSLTFLHSHANCWDTLGGLRSAKFSVGTSPYGTDIHSEEMDIHLHPRELSSLIFQPGVQYFLTIEVQDAAGWVSRRTSDGFIIDLVRDCIYFG